MSVSSSELISLVDRTYGIKLALTAPVTNTMSVVCLVACTAFRTITLYSEHSGWFSKFQAFKRDIIRIAVSPIALVAFEILALIKCLFPQNTWYEQLQDNLFGDLSFEMGQVKRNQSHPIKEQDPFKDLSSRIKNLTFVVSLQQLWKALEPPIDQSDLAAKVRAVQEQEQSLTDYITGFGLKLDALVWYADLQGYLNADLTDEEQKQALRNEIQMSLGCLSSLERPIQRQDLIEDPFVNIDAESLPPFYQELKRLWDSIIENPLERDSIREHTNNLVSTEHVHMIGSYHGGLLLFERAKDLLNPDEWDQLIQELKADIIKRMGDFRSSTAASASTAAADCLGDEKGSDIVSVHLSDAELETDNERQKAQTILGFVEHLERLPERVEVVVSTLNHEHADFKSALEQIKNLLDNEDIIPHKHTLWESVSTALFNGITSLLQQANLQSELRPSLELLQSSLNAYASLEKEIPLLVSMLNAQTPAWIAAEKMLLYLSKKAIKANLRESRFDAAPVAQSPSCNPTEEFKKQLRALLEAEEA